MVLDQGIAALLGVALGFVLSTISSVLKSREIGKRFENAVRKEIKAAKNQIHEKMLWILRPEESTPDPTRNPDHMVLVEGRLFYLGEPEGFAVNLPFWEQNTRTIVEVTSTKSFGMLSEDIILINQFVSKFRDMKMAFASGFGDPKRMAAACLKDLMKIHNDLISEPKLAVTYSTPSPTPLPPSAT